MSIIGIYWHNPGFHLLLSWGSAEGFLRWSPHLMELCWIAFAFPVHNLPNSSSKSVLVGSCGCYELILSPVIQPYSVISL
jgi:hypothetical protein